MFPLHSRYGEYRRVHGEEEEEQKVLLQPETRRCVLHRASASMQPEGRSRSQPRDQWSIDVSHGRHGHCRTSCTVRGSSSGCDWTLLPAPLLGVCLSFLTLGDLLSVRQTCSDWRLCRTEQLVSPSSLPPLTVTVCPDKVDALRFLDNALSAIGPITELTLTEQAVRAWYNEEEHPQSGSCSDYAQPLHRVSRGFPSSWTLNDAVQQLIAMRRRPSAQSGSSNTSGRYHETPRHRDECQRRSFPLTKLTLSHGAHHSPLTVTSLSALCFLLPTLRELHITTRESPAGCNVGSPVDDESSDVLLRPLSQLRLRALTLPTWAKLRGLRSVVDNLAYFNAGCNGPLWSELSVETPFTLTPCGRSLTSLTLNSGRSTQVGSLEADTLLLCSKLPALSSLSLMNFWFNEAAISQVELLPGLTTLMIPGCVLKVDLIHNNLLPHLSSLTSLDLGTSPLGLRNLGDIEHLVSCCPQLTSLSNVSVLRNVCQALCPLVGLRSLSLRSRCICWSDDQVGMRPFLSFISVEVKRLPSLSALTSLCIQFLPSSALKQLLLTPLPALKTLEVHIDFVTYQQEVGEWSYRQMTGVEFPMEVSVIHPAVVARFQHSQPLPSLTRLHYSSPQLRPSVIHFLSFVTSLLHLTLELYQPVKWEMAVTAKVAEVTEFNRDRRYSVQDVDLLHLAALPSLHRLELHHISQLTARVLPVLSCLDSLRQLTITHCDGIDASDVAGLANHCSYQQQQPDSPLLGGDCRTPVPQLLDSLRLENCLKLPASNGRRLRLLSARWSALKLNCPNIISSDSTVQPSPPVHHFHLRTERWHFGVIPPPPDPAKAAEPGREQKQPQAFAFISLHRDQLDSLSSKSLHQPPLNEDSWRSNRRHPGVVELMWLWYRLLTDRVLQLRRWRDRSTGGVWDLMFSIHWTLALLLIFSWAMLPAAVVGLYLGDSGPSNDHIIAIVIVCLTRSPVGSSPLDIVYKRRMWTVQMVDYQTRLSRRREIEGGEIDDDGMDEGGTLVGWNTKSLLLALLAWYLTFLQPWVNCYGFAFGSLRVGRRLHVAWESSNSSILPLQSSSSGSVLHFSI